MDNRKKYICIDIGGTAIKYGIITDNGTLLSRSETPTEAFRGGPSILEKVTGITGQFCQSEEISGICISTAGIVDTKTGMIVHSAPVIPAYRGINYKKSLEAQFHIPCEVENDVNCAGLAEYMSGAGKDCGTQPMLMLTVGTSIGGCLILDGQIFHGYRNCACEVGYMRLSDRSFHSLASASTLVKKVAEWKHDPQTAWNGRRIFAQARQGDVVCQKAIDEMADMLGLGIANISFVISPKVVVLGGGIMAQEDYLREKIQKSVESHSIDYMASHIRIAFAQHKNDAGMLGAFYHFINCR